MIVTVSAVTLQLTQFPNNPTTGRTPGTASLRWDSWESSLTSWNQEPLSSREFETVFSELYNQTLKSVLPRSFLMTLHVVKSARRFVSTVDTEVSLQSSSFITEFVL